MRRRPGSDDYFGPIIQDLSEEERLLNKSIGSCNGGGGPSSLLEDDEDNLPEVDDGIPFTTKMRQATRSVHGLSDALANAKLGLAMSDDKVWSEDLLIFYEIFKHLNLSLDRLSPKSLHFKKMASVILPLKRTVAFQNDLQFYYGPTYLQSYTPRPSVLAYLKHLQILEEREPLRLLAYVYHLYMGLLSGGQIPKPGDEVPTLPGHEATVETEAPSGGGLGSYVNMDELEEPPGADGFLQ